jgi:hypothetical protein
MCKGQVRLSAGMHADHCMMHVQQMKVPRPSPRISADRLQEHLIKAMAASDVHAQE